MTLAEFAIRYREQQGRTQEVRSALYDAIRAAHLEGMSVRAIARETRLSFGRIGQIVRV